jgi:hypothetical protein
VAPKETLVLVLINGQDFEETEVGKEEEITSGKGWRYGSMLRVSEEKKTSELQ